MEITYNVKNIEPYDYKPLLLPSETRHEPNVKINDIGYKYYTLIMYDPDAIHGTYWHWIITNITKNSLQKGNVLLKYSGPNPPDAKQHRYVFELYAKNEKFNDKNVDSRNMTLEEGKHILGIQNNPILKYVFMSEREKKKGGTKKRKKHNTKHKNTWKYKNKKTKKKKSLYRK